MGVSYVYIPTLLRVRFINYSTTPKVVRVVNGNAQTFEANVDE